MSFGGEKMEHVQNSFANLMKKNEDFKKRYASLKEQVLSHPRIQQFLLEQEGEVTTSMLEGSLVKLYEYIGQSMNCDDCQTLEQCKKICCRATIPIL
ncbi:hypothetical protein GCM10020331_032810 [Ectobacillus funiculus]